MITFLATIQYEMDAQYQEKSMLTNLFAEHKFWGWAGLLLIFITICLVLFFQVRSWEEEDQDRNRM